MAGTQLTQAETPTETQAEELARRRAESGALREHLGASLAGLGPEEQVARLSDEVARLQQHLVRLQRLAALGTMTAMVAHEFNNILTPIISYAQLARTNPALSEKAVARAADGGQRAANVCRAILGLARDEQDEPVELNVSELISETILAMARDPERDAIQTVLSAPSDLTITTRRMELQQVLLNLLLNARRAVLDQSPPRRLEVAAERANGNVLIRVIDNGTGIPQEDMPELFSPFFTTADGQEGRPKGTGLGLAVCKQILQSLGGHIWAGPTPGGGATFSVRLPA